MTQPYTDADVELVARTDYVACHRGEKTLADEADREDYRIDARAVLSALAAAGRLRTVERGRRIRAAAIREAIGAVAAHGPISGARWMEELERFAQIVEQPEEDTDG